MPTSQNLQNWSICTCLITYWSSTSALIGFHLSNYYLLDISNSGISDSLSNFNLVFSPQLKYMNLSYNQISGQIPNLSLEFTFSPIVDLSSNKLSSRIPKFLFESAHLDFSKNMLSDTIFSLCEVQNGNLNFLDISNNQLSRPIPDSC